MCHEGQSRVQSSRGARAGRRAAGHHGVVVRVIAGIFARGGSKGVPRKNVRPLAGRPLIGHAINVAQGVARVSKVIVSTDDAEIAQTARNLGAEVPFMRPAHLATDTASEWLAWRHLIREVGDGFGESRDDILLSVPCTSPLREVGDVEACLDALLGSDADVAITMTPAARHPAFNMVTLADDGAVSLAMQLDPPVVRRQDAPALYDVTTVAYAVRAPHVLLANGLFEGRVVASVVPAARALDVDTEHDWVIAECLMARRGTEG